MAWVGNCLGFITGPASSTLDSFLESNTGKALAWVWDLAMGGIASIILLSSMAEKLRREVRHLTDSETEVLEEAEIGKLENKRLRPSARTWLEEVGKVVDDAREFEDSFGRVEGFSLSSRYELGGKVDKLLKEVRELREQKENLVIVGEAMPDPVEPQAIPQHKIVDIDENFSKIRRMLADDNCTIIGIYGMGGVGKTTLLKEINNKLHQTRSDQFDLVIFVIVSNNVNIWEIQKVIGNRLGYSDDCPRRPLPEDKNERKNRLLASLRQKKFLLLLDDIWDKLELHEIGIPLSHLSQRGSKIVFTTRSRSVCTSMDAAQNVVEVRRLSESSSWELFCQKSGKISERDWTISTKLLADQIVKGCGGLPLALITVGSAMASVFTDVDWEGALMTLNLMARELPDMEDKVLIPLKFSYDRLKDKRHKECLLYCALYPEDFSIWTRELIDYWVGEGFLEEEGDSIDIVRNRGRAAINALKNACLLEDANTEESSDYVKLHDMIHKMAIWITSGKCKDEKQIFLSKPGEDLTTVPSLKRWSQATRISLSHNRIEEMPEIQDCHKLKTLFLRSNKCLKHINRGFFQFMPCLTVLDLSRTGLHDLPPDIGLLRELRFLDLSWNYQLKSLPMEVWGLKRLKMLNLHGSGLHRIPKEAISLFSSLQSLKIFGTDNKWRGGWNSHDNKHVEKEVVLKDLDGLKQLEELELDIEINSQEDWCGLRDSRNLLAKVTSLGFRFMDIDSLDSVKDIWRANQLTWLTIRRCEQLKQLTFPANQATNMASLDLISLPIEKIDWKDGNSILREPPTGATFKHLAHIQFGKLALREITWTRKLPNLGTLALHDCNEMVEMITIEEPEMTSMCSIKKDSLFPALRRLYLSRMKNLKSICNQPLTFPRLESFQIGKCSMLKKLPFRVNSGENIRLIVGDKTWWNELEWEDADIKLKFSTILIERRKLERERERERENIET